ncbi:hypothetical protein LOZ53_002361 [Ophidiomyces ophidiicola]|uniref:Uncharacterized protein n=1 Tax=Ophidiomyces ophidiicola TaxID=1387563 RepID=A0ACB8V5L0_9EURO|nr:uncharacterized protein LOZ57_006076 [Ophidiomyces ophidiicola]KAI1923606.1 hypothetical protein LOZ64_000863 [Ophidiomyces ophidiicola]KAI1939792.1 hypothetical protein LOZ57_006076 [Ophidiomyces ophidiicola]KAI1956142.1 hypothetical protein LOZ62_000136 [Ophidiomyces ophidiicola]KAI1967825.1 hypothetical protein LOZ59_000642 [Ophidiomyces ophidiicola]KAI1975275.1 hypothetical protein LOZ56_000801 [Ophidiomyces ophidiicola]
MTSEASCAVDYINLRNIRLPLPVVLHQDAWSRHSKPQLAVISLRVAFPRVLLQEAGENDDVETTLNYSSLYRALENTIRKASNDTGSSTCTISGNQTLGEFMTMIEDLVKSEQINAIQATKRKVSSDSVQEAIDNVEITLHLPKAALRAAGGVECVSRRHGPGWGRKEFRIVGIRSYCIIGVNDHERTEKQAVDITLSFQFDESKCEELTSLSLNYLPLTSSIAKAIDVSSFETVEALATMIAKTVIIGNGFSEVTVSVEKLNALAFVEYSGVEITRTASFFP